MMTESAYLQYLPTHLPTYLSTCLPIYLPIYLSIYQPTNLSILLDTDHMRHPRCDEGITDGSAVARGHEHEL